MVRRIIPNPGICPMFYAFGPSLIISIEKGSRKGKRADWKTDSRPHQSANLAQSRTTEPIENSRPRSPSSSSWRRFAQTAQSNRQRHARRPFPYRKTHWRALRLRKHFKVPKKLTFCLKIFFSQRYWMNELVLRGQPHHHCCPHSIALSRWLQKIGGDTREGHFHIGKTHRRAFRLQKHFQFAKKQIFWWQNLILLQHLWMNELVLCGKPHHHCCPHTVALARQLNQIPGDSGWRPLP